MRNFRDLNIYDKELILNSGIALCDLSDYNEGKKIGKWNFHLPSTFKLNEEDTITMNKILSYFVSKGMTLTDTKYGYFLENEFMVGLLFGNFQIAYSYINDGEKQGIYLDLFSGEFGKEDEWFLGFLRDLREILKDEFEYVEYSFD